MSPWVFNAWYFVMIIARNVNVTRNEKETVNVCLRWERSPFIEICVSHQYSNSCCSFRTCGVTSLAEYSLRSGDRSCQHSERPLPAYHSRKCSTGLSLTISLELQVIPEILRDTVISQHNEDSLSYTEMAREGINEHSQDGA
jgi:hypothetical protein